MLRAKTQLNTAQPTLKRINLKTGTLEDITKQHEQLSKAISRGLTKEKGKKWDDYKIADIQKSIIKLPISETSLPQLDEWEALVGRANDYLQAKFFDDTALKNKPKYQEREEDVQLLQVIIVSKREAIAALIKPANKPSALKATKSVEHKTPSANVDLRWGDNVESSLDATLEQGKTNRTGIKQSSDTYAKFHETLAQDGNIDRLKRAQIKADEVKNIGASVINKNLTDAHVSKEDFEKLETLEKLEDRAKDFQKPPAKRVGFFSSCSCCCQDDAENAVQSEQRRPLMQTMN